jgi:serine/threonine-protein kinase
MATVYLAHDLKHDRKVALKVLKPELGAVLGAERFLSEIKVTAKLQHPNLLPLFDSGEANGLLYYVMPFVEGETLRARLDREKQLRVEAAVGIATGVRYALAYAHERGIIHRDLKPENILFQAGQPVVADFGIALAVSNAGGVRATQTGLALGTPQYMSPEQAVGDRAIDARTDIYSLASVLYEMLAGEPPHTAGSVQAVIMKVITDPARPVQDLRKNVPTNVAAAIAKALEKVPADRFETARAFSEALLNPAFTTSETSAARQTRIRGRGVSTWLFAAVSGVAVAALAAAGWAWRRPSTASPMPRARFALEVPDSQAVVATSGTRALVISPNGSEIVYAGHNVRGQRVLYRRRLDELTVHEVPGSVSPSAPVFSPTGDLAFERSDRSLATLPRDGRPPARIVDDAGRVSWGDGDVIAFMRGGSLWRTNSSGGPVTRLTTVDSVAGEGDTWPFVLPGSTAVLFNHYREARTADEVDVFVVRIADGVVKRLGIKGSNPRYVSSGHIIVPQSDGTLLAAPFDLETLEMRGTPVRVLEGLYVRPTGVAQLDVSRNGVLTYIEGGELQHPVIVDRTGVEHDVGFADGAYVHPRLSPNTDRVVVERSEGVRSDIWIAARATGQASRLTRDGKNSSPEWSADGRRVAWIHADSVGASIRWQSADGSGAPEVIPTPGHIPFRFVFTPDGKSIVVAVGGPFRHDIWVFPLDGKSAPRALARTDADELQPSISPDGRWLAFTSNETGRSEVFVLSMDDPSTRVQITTTGATEPAWRDTHSLIARSSSSFVSISLGFAPRIEVTRRDSMFADTYPRGSPDRAFDISTRTGEVVTLARASSKRDRIVVVTGWLDELKERISARRVSP